MTPPLRRRLSRTIASAALLLGLLVAAVTLFGEHDSPDQPQPAATTAP